MSKKNKIKVTSGCRVDGKSLEAGKFYEVSTYGARLAVGAGRAILVTKDMEAKWRAEAKVKAEAEAKAKAEAEAKK